MLVALFTLTHAPIVTNRVIDSSTNKPPIQTQNDPTDSSNIGTFLDDMSKGLRNVAETLGANPDSITHILSVTNKLEHAVENVQQIEGAFDDIQQTTGTTNDER